MDFPCLSGQVSQPETEIELFTACRRRVAGSVVTGAAGVPNKPFATTNCCAAKLNCTISEGEELCNADCTELDASAEVSGPVAVPLKLWSTSANPGFTAATEAISYLIGRTQIFSSPARMSINRYPESTHEGR